MRTLFCVTKHLLSLSKVIIPPLRMITVFSQPFGNILSLVPLAESVVKLNAVCMQCYMEAAYTKRTGMEKEVRG